MSFKRSKVWHTEFTILVCIIRCTLWARKTCHFVVDENFGISWAIFKQFLYHVILDSWWCNSCVTSHPMKFCFMELLLKIKHAEFWRQNFDRKPVGTYWMHIRMWSWAADNIAAVAVSWLLRTRSLSTWQMIAASCPTALGALCGQQTFRLAWCHEH